jgi:hydrogenase expression/formation protein HypE
VAAFTCPTPLSISDRIVLGHGSGGRLSAELLGDIFLPLFSNPVLDRLDDQAVFNIGGAQVAFTTDSFVVKPLFFQGGTSDLWQYMARLTIWQWVAPGLSF